MPLVRVRGRSMVPTLRPGQLVWFSSRSSHPPVRGGIVLIRLDRPPKGLYLKRLVGLPGETIELRSSRAFINGQSLLEPYVPESAALEPQQDVRCALSADRYFVLGDARDDSLDSRRFGPVTRSEIAGVAIWRLWPPGAMKRPTF